MYISFVASPLMKYAFFASLDEIKWHIHSKNLNILYLLLIDCKYYVLCVKCSTVYNYRNWLKYIKGTEQYALQLTVQSIFNGLQYIKPAQSIQFIMISMV